MYVYICICSVFKIKWRKIVYALVIGDAIVVCKQLAKAISCLLARQTTLIDDQIDDDDHVYHYYLSLIIDCYHFYFILIKNINIK